MVHQEHITLSRWEDPSIQEIQEIRESTPRKRCSGVVGSPEWAISENDTECMGEQELTTTRSRLGKLNPTDRL